MKPFKIVITGASRATYWYADKIGQEFEVLRADTTLQDGASFIVRNETAPFFSGAVLWDDCELAPQPAERNAAELAQLRRVAEAAYLVASVDSGENEKFAQKAELTNALKAWKAGQC